MVESRGPVLGFLVNPVAGLGGPLGEKGSDDPTLHRRPDAQALAGRAARRAQRALDAMGSGALRHVVTGPGALGGMLLPDAEQLAIPCTGTAADTKSLVAAMQDRVDLILFAGGDGTARDVAAANGAGVPILGIPAGVKMHSGVFARSPERAGRAAEAFLANPRHPIEMIEILDIDESARRRGRLSAQLFAVARTPASTEGARQNPKAGGGDVIADLDAALGDYHRRMTPDRAYILGPGTTLAALKDRLGGGTLLGVDLARNGRIVARDLSETALLDALEQESAARIVLSVVGGQGFVLGRGNQQISHRVIERVGPQNIDVICASPKLAALKPLELTIDTGDPGLDARLAGWWPITTGPGRKQVVRVVH
ncbi:ATP-NAD kinase family protein [Cognatishimia sp. F0-27]|uniref:ATP-NAD kinase family protein n=1 Tax=Cognatishimia sp. F0-27 TaxID=2816855 RepID=UPI001D0C9A3E|nr:ATP-NAD kinase family protein [Cognatishimia sp. F0-27]MCC1493119.1 ATP-NAD kinase family protein [Cognatishimia sp. F0-27]